MNIEIGNKYQIGELIGEGAYGKIFVALNKFTGEKVAIKIEKKDKKLLRHEAIVMNILKDIDGIPKIRTFGTDLEFNYIIMDRLSHSTEYLLTLCGGKFKLSTVLLIGIHLLERIENIHNKGIIHRDLKPDNILIGFAKNANIIHLIDFGLSTKYLDINKNHKKIAWDKSLIGSIKYASINVQNGIECSRRDDIESIGYILLYFLMGVLPWQDIRQNEQKNELVLNLKKNMFSNLHINNVPLEFIIYVNYCRKLNYEDIPNYTYLKTLFLNLLKLHDSACDEFEWATLI